MMHKIESLKRKGGEYQYEYTAYCRCGWHFSGWVRMNEWPTVQASFLYHLTRKANNYD